MSVVKTKRDDFQRNGAHTVSVPVVNNRSSSSDTVRRKAGVTSKHKGRPSATIHSNTENRSFEQDREDTEDYDGRRPEYKEETIRGGVGTQRGDWRVGVGAGVGVW